MEAKIIKEVIILFLILNIESSQLLSSGISIYSFVLKFKIHTQQNKLRAS